MFPCTQFTFIDLTLIDTLKILSIELQTHVCMNTLLIGDCIRSKTGIIIIHKVTLT